MIHPKNIHEGPNGVQIGEYGEYPQIVADDRTGERLEKLHESGSLCSTGKNYTFDSVDVHNNSAPFKAIPYTEYELDGKRFIRVLARPAYRTSYLSTGEQVEVDKPYWVQVKPIEWLMDRSGTMVAKKCLFAGIQVDTADRPNGDFAKTFMKHYLDTYFAKEMEPTVLMPRREASKNRTESDKKGSIKCKTSGKKQQGLLSLLRSNQPATVIKKATKKTIAKNCRSKNSKTSEL